MRKVSAHKPDVAVVDIRMPPTNTDDGLRAALEIRRSLPGTGVLVLSQYVEEGYALELVGDKAEGTGYLLKDRVADVDALRRRRAAGRRGRLGARPGGGRARCSAGGAATTRSPSSPSASARCSG